MYYRVIKLPRAIYFNDKSSWAAFGAKFDLFAEDCKLDGYASEYYAMITKTNKHMGSDEMFSKFE